MSALALIIVSAIIVYSCRLSGFVVKSGGTPHSWQTSLPFIPITVFSTLIVQSMLPQTDLLDIKLLSLAVAGGVYWATRQFGLAILSGFGMLWLLTLLTG